jgi:glycosyltransferase involved in cell wall biosynthesis
VIPTYNQADFLEVALQSVLGQTVQDIEVIVVNNHSTDHTLEVIGRLDDDRVRVINYHNGGIIGAARNMGIQAASATYVAFLDSDDTWHSNKLEMVAKVFKDDPAIGLVSHNQEIVRDGQVVKRSHYGPPSSFRGSLTDYLLQVGNCISTSATVVARSLLNQVGCFSEDPALVTVEDYDLWLRLSTVCEFRLMPEVLGIQNFYQGSYSSNAELHLRSTLAVLDKHLIESKEAKRALPKRAIRRRHANAYFGAARQYHRRGEFKKPLGYYTRCLRKYPLFGMAYAGLALLFVDQLMGIDRRKKITDYIVPGI